MHLIDTIGEASITYEMNKAMRLSRFLLQMSLCLLTSYFLFEVLLPYKPSEKMHVAT